MFRKRSPVAATTLLYQLSKRAESLTPAQQATSFVTFGRMGGALQSRDSRVIFGRRGTGKTHILSYVAKSASDKGEVPCLIDLRTLGSNNSIYSDHSIAEHARATTLIRDLLTAIHDRLLENYTGPKSPLSGSGVDKSINGLFACVKTVQVTESLEVAGRISSERAEKFMAGGEVRFGVAESAVSLSAECAKEVANAAEFSTVSRGVPRLSVNMGDAFQMLRDISEKAKVRIWLLLDEWSALPVSLQPYLADFLRRAVLPIQNITVQIAAIEYRCKFRLDANNDRIGLELGSDISADIDLDDFFVYDFNPQAAVDFFKDMLFRHLVTFAGEDGLVERSAQDVINSIFSQDRVFAELARASEGVARDFINILQHAAMMSDGSKISMNEVRSAAKHWFEGDKQRNLDTNPKAQELLEWIRDQVIDGRKARAFLLKSGESSNEIDFLFDERVLHIAKRSYSAKDDPGVRYRVWKVDYGCYVDLINTAKNPTSFIDGAGISAMGEIVVPDDDFRAVRRAVLRLSDFEGRNRS